MEVDDKSLVYNINLCRICQIPHNLNLINTSTIREGHQTYLDILKFIFKDILWIEDNFISVACAICLQKVTEIAEFKRLCLNTNLQREAINLTFQTKVETVPIKVEELSEVEEGDDDPLAISAGVETDKIYTNTEEEIQEIPKDQIKVQKSTKSVKKHIKNIKNSNSKLYQCNICNEKLPSLPFLERHIYRHNGTRNYTCSVCGRLYITQADLITHFKLHAVDLKFECEICNKRFKAARNLIKHRTLVHMDPKDFKHLCTICGNKFAVSQQLKEHSKRHNQIKNYHCDICGKDFVAKGEMLRHVNTHSNLRPYKCDLCPADYTRNGPLLIHKTKQHGIGNHTKSKGTMKMYECNHCGKSIAFKTKFERHVRSHTGEKPFKCRRCDAKFICKSYIKGHLQKVHDICVDKSKDFDATEYYEVLDSMVQVDEEDSI